MGRDALAFLDDDGTEVVLDADEADALLRLTSRFEAATVSACPTCTSRVLATVALVDVLEGAGPHPRARELLELAEDAPTLHLYVHDLVARCRHAAWLDPGATEWREVLDDLAGAPRPLR